MKPQAGDTAPRPPASTGERQLRGELKFIAAILELPVIGHAHGS
jgi:hypothetical protein